MPDETRPSIAQLFLSFLRLGLTAFGGPSMVAYIRRLAVDKKQWLDEATFRDGVALCQMIPGATAMQAAAYVGLKTRGVLGAGASFIGFGLPAFCLMMAFSAMYAETHDLPEVASAFSGLQAIIVAMIANAALNFGRSTLKTLPTFAIAGVSAALFWFRLNPILVILLAAVLGLAIMRSERTDTPSTSSAPQSYPYTKPLIFNLLIAAIGLAVLFFLNRTLFDLATVMLRIDLFAFGGGFASIPLMLHEIVEARGWMDSQTFLNGIVLGQVTPGPIVITATFVGYQLCGFTGGAVATIGIFLPSFVVLVAMSPYFDRLRTSPIFNRIICGVFCSFVGLLITVTIRFAIGVHWDMWHLLLALGAFAALLLKVDILWVVLTGTIISVIVFS